MTVHLRSWAAALGGDVSGRGVICPGPGHSARDRSLSVMPFATAPNGFLVNSFAGDDPLVCLDYVRSKLGLPEFSPARPRKPAAGSHGAPAKPPEPPQNTRARAMSIWSESRDPPGTFVEVYLGLRRLGLPDRAANEAVRYHPDYPFERERFPAMICLVRGIVTNEPQGVHRTALMPDGTAVKRNGKTFRLSLGAIGGGAIKLDPDEDVEQGPCIGEGVETCLSGRQIGLQPVWSAVNTGGVKNFPIVPGVDGLHIFKENDANGQSAKDVEACARRWYEAGRGVIIVEPDAGKDLNDELQEAAR